MQLLWLGALNTQSEAEQYLRHMKKVGDIEQSYQWLDKARLKNSTEALMMAAQEQAKP